MGQTALRIPAEFRTGQRDPAAVAFSTQRPSLPKSILSRMPTSSQYAVRGGLPEIVIDSGGLLVVTAEQSQGGQAREYGTESN